MKKIFIGHKVKLLNSEQEGITLQINSWSSENMVEKYAVSLDNEIKIKRIIEKNISVGEQVSNKIYFDRLIRDIQSQDELTRIFASEILCDFLEFEIDKFDLQLLEIGIERIISQIRIEKNIKTEQKLVEGLFEYIWQKKTSKKVKIELLERLTKIDSYYIWSYLGDELEGDYENLSSQILNKYYKENKTKWAEKNEHSIKKITKPNKNYI